MAHRNKRRRPAAVAQIPRTRPSLSRDRVASLLCAALIAAAGIWAYATSFHGVFVYDDLQAIVKNPHVRSLWPLTGALTAPPEVTISGRPVAAVSFALNYALAGADVRDVMSPPAAGDPGDAADRYARNLWGYHLVNLAVHLGAALALFGCVRRTLERRPASVGPAEAGRDRRDVVSGFSRSDRYGDAAIPLAGTAALLWVVHPLNTEAVTYVVQRVESLMGLFYLLTLYCAIRALPPQPTNRPEGQLPATRDAEARGGGAPRAVRNWTAGSIAACALGMGTKEVMITAPLVVWVWDYVFGVDRRERRPLYAGLAVTWILLAALVMTETRPRSVGFALGWSAWTYLETQAQVVFHYLRIAVVPSPLVFDYGWPRADSFASVAPYGAVVTTLVALSAVAAWKRRPIGFAGVWFFAILAPTSSVLPITTEVAAEHRLYLPLAAVIVLAVIGAYELGSYVLKGMAPHSLRRPGLALAAALVPAAVVAVVFVSMTRDRNRDYWSDERIWIDTIEKRPANARAHVGYGADLLLAGRFPEAEEQLRTAVRLDAGSALAHMNLGAALSAQGRLDDGLGHLERARTLDPSLDENYGLLGQAYSDRGDYGRAIAYLSRAVDLMPDQPLLANRLAWLLATVPESRLRDGTRAASLAEGAVRQSHGQSAVFLETLAAAYAELQRFGDAIAALRQAVTIAHAEHDEPGAAQLEQRLARYAAGQK